MKGLVVLFFLVPKTTHLPRLFVRFFVFFFFLCTYEIEKKKRFNLFLPICITQVYVYVLTFLIDN